MKILSFSNKSIVYPFRILLGCTIVWWSLYYLHDSRKIWAVISVIVVTDPDIDTLRIGTVSRIVNTLVGCLTGLAFIYLAGVNFWSLMAAIMVSVLLSTSFKNYPASWKLAPSTVAIIMVPSISENITWQAAMEVALARTGEVLYGTLVAFLLGVALSAIRKRYFPKFEKEFLGKHEEKVQGGL
ncbi:hypothetical protein BH11BAC1_BH11BAC1_04470 [soil metagenome]